MRTVRCSLRKHAAHGSASPGAGPRSRPLVTATAAISHSDRPADQYRTSTLRHVLTEDDAEEAGVPWLRRLEPIPRVADMPQMQDSDQPELSAGQLVALTADIVALHGLRSQRIPYGLGLARRPASFAVRSPRARARPRALLNRCWWGGRTRW